MLHIDTSAIHHASTQTPLAMAVTLAVCLLSILIALCIAHYIMCTFVLLHKLFVYGLAAYALFVLLGLDAETLQRWSVQTGEWLQTLRPAAEPYLQAAVAAWARLQ